MTYAPFSLLCDFCVKPIVSSNERFKACHFVKACVTGLGIQFLIREQLMQ